jgi:hypothetical protein
MKELGGSGKILNSSIKRVNTASLLEDFLLFATHVPSKGFYLAVPSKGFYLAELRSHRVRRPADTVKRSKANETEVTHRTTKYGAGTAGRVNQTAK